MEVRGQRSQTMDRCIGNSDDDDAATEMGMKTTETQTELIDESSPSPSNSVEFQIVDELPAHIDPSSINNNHSHLDINALRNVKDIKCIDDDASSSDRRVLFPSENPETKL